MLQNNVEKLHGSDDKLMRELSRLAKNNGFGKQTLTTIPLVLVRSIYVILSASIQCRVYTFNKYTWTARFVLAPFT